MGAHAKRIADRDLVKLLKKSGGRDDISPEDVEKLVALVNDVADIAGPLLERIPVTFKQYTEHNIEHCRNLIGLMGRFIPRETLKRMNALELAVLILSALLHDFGMFVSEGEKRETLKSADFESFLAGHHDRAAALEEARRQDDHDRAEIIQDALLAEFFRRVHPERVRTNVEKNLPGKLVYGDKDISKYVLDVCESHAWGVHESHDPQYANKTVSQLRPDAAVKVFETLNTFAVNVEYDINVYPPGGAGVEVIPRRRWESEKDWPEMLVKAGDWEYDEPEGVEAAREIANEILAPSRIPLSRDDFSPRLRGDAWLWLLQDRGTLCPAAGFLRMTPRGLSVVGLPRRLFRFSGKYLWGNRDSTSEQLKKLLSAKGGAALTPADQFQFMIFLSATETE